MPLNKRKGKYGANATTALNLLLANQRKEIDSSMTLNRLNILNRHRAIKYSKPSNQVLLPRISVSPQWRQDSKLDSLMCCQKGDRQKNSVNVPRHRAIKYSTPFNQVLLPRMSVSPQWRQNSKLDSLMCCHKGDRQKLSEYAQAQSY